MQQTDYALRTSDDQAGLKYLDCSELVCRVMAADGITSGIKSKSTAELKVFLADEDKFIRSRDEPKPGDIFLWRNSGGGHTGIVVSYDPNTGIVVTAEARGKSYGTQKNVERHLSVFTETAGWEGFFRPKVETPDGKVVLSGVSEEEKIAKIQKAIADLAAWTERLKKKLEAAEKRREERRKKREERRRQKLEE